MIRYRIHWCESSVATRSHSTWTDHGPLGEGYESVYMQDDTLMAEVNIDGKRVAFILGTHDSTGWAYQEDSPCGRVHGKKQMRSFLIEAFVLRGRGVPA